MSNSVKESFVLDGVLICLLLLVLELFDGPESVHRPVRQFPGFRPTNVHRLGGDNYDY